MHSDKPQSPGSAENLEAAAVVLSDVAALPVLKDGEILGGQHIPWGSNYTFQVHIDAGDQRYLRAIYKPRDGERPLDDFPSESLYKREYAAYLLSRALGWPAIPLTVIRDGPYGVGSMQLYVESEANLTYFDLIGDHADELVRFAVFDVLANNADRKAGHCMLGSEGQIWSIDHGLTFHSDFKLRTVMVEFWGARIPQPVVQELNGLAQHLRPDAGLTTDLAELLTEQEMGALRGRLDSLLSEPVIPKLDHRVNVPWPLT